MIRRRARRLPTRAARTLWALLTAAALIGCGSKHDSDFGGPGPINRLDTANAVIALDSTRPADSLRFGTLNMSIGFPVTQLLFTDMKNDTVAYKALDTLSARYLKGMPLERIRAMARDIVAESLQVVGLQEVMVISIDKGPETDFLVELLKEIKAAAGPEFIAFRKKVNDTILDGVLGGDTLTIHFGEGNALLIHPTLTVLDTLNFMYENLLPIPIANARPTERAFSYARVRSPGGVSYQIYNTHLEVFQEYSSPQALEQLRMKDSLWKEGHVQVAMGDFNVEPRSGAHEIFLEAGFKDTFDGLGVAAESGTCCVAGSRLWDSTAAFSNRRIDYIVARRFAKALYHHTSAKTRFPSGGITIAPSDHRMVVTRIVAQ